MSSTSGSDSTSCTEKAAGGRLRGQRRWGFGGRKVGRRWGREGADLGGVEAARGEEVSQVRRETHLRDRHVRHRDRRTPGKVRRGLGDWGFEILLFARLFFSSPLLFSEEAARTKKTNGGQFGPFNEPTHRGLID